MSLTYIIALFIKLISADLIVIVDTDPIVIVMSKLFNLSFRRRILND
jgi:hypothetical protein